MCRVILLTSIIYFCSRYFYRSALWLWRDITYIRFNNFFAFALSSLCGFFFWRSHKIAPGYWFRQSVLHWVNISSSICNLISCQETLSFLFTVSFPNILWGLVDFHAVFLVKFSCQNTEQIEYCYLGFCFVGLVEGLTFPLQYRVVVCFSFFHTIYFHFGFSVSCSDSLS